MSQKTDKKEQSNPHKTGRLVIVILLLLLLAVAIAFFASHPDKEEIQGGKREADALQGSLQKMTDEEIQEAMNNIVDQGMFRISIANDIVALEDGTAEVRIENNLQNRYLMKVRIQLDETGEEIYTTDFIEPGYYIQTAELNQHLKPGEYPATATFYAYYADTEELVGMVGAHVTIHVVRAEDMPDAP